MALPKFATQQCVDPDIIILCIVCIRFMESKLGRVGELVSCLHPQWHRRSFVISYASGNTADYTMCRKCVKVKPPSAHTPQLHSSGVLEVVS